MKKSGKVKEGEGRKVKERRNVKKRRKKGEGRKAKEEK